MALTEANRVFGITPAWAGKSDNSENQSSKKQDHPRVGGEKALSSTALGLAIGSPPRGRGKDAVLVAALLHDRITPAWAGKRRCTARREPASRDHPRVGGEKLPSIISCIVQPGSPPRGRGKGLFSTIPGGCPGITPAWAGKRPFAGFEPAACGDHPRVGGEKTSCAMARPVAPGSPPRGRGKGRAHLCVRGTPRITPAWAGKRLKRSHRSGIFISGPIPFHSVLHRPAGSGGSRAGRDGSPAGQPQNTGPA